MSFFTYIFMNSSNHLNAEHESNVIFQFELAQPGLTCAIVKEKSDVTS